MANIQTKEHASDKQKCQRKEFVMGVPDAEVQDTRAASAGLRRVPSLWRQLLVVVGLVIGLSMIAQSANAATPIHELPPLAAENELAFGPMSGFLTEQRKPVGTPPEGRDGRFDWASDGCTTPAIGDLAKWNHTFANPCLRHDFSYRNFGTGGAVLGTDTEAQRKLIDNRFLGDMNDVCNTTMTTYLKRAECRWVASVYYTIVRSSLGKQAFYS